MDCRCRRPRLATDIDICQYRCMSKSLLELTPGRGRRLLLAADPRAALAPSRPSGSSPLVKALADPVRLRLLSLVASHADGEACVCDLNDAFDLSQPTISHHLKLLHDAGLLDRDKRGVWVYYRVNPGALGDLAALLGGVARDRTGGPPRRPRSCVGTAFLVAAVIGSGIAAQRLSPDDVGLQLLENSIATGAALVALILALPAGLGVVQPGRHARRAGARA